MKPVLRLILPIGVIAVFLMLDTRLSQSSSALRTVVLLPYVLLNVLVQRLSLPEDYHILVLLIVGSPLLAIYWFGIYFLLVGGPDDLTKDEHTPS